MTDEAPRAPARMHWVKVWDAPVRLFHWALVALVVTAYATARSGRIEWHFYTGYTILGLVTFRIVWGFIGSETARFSSFVRSPRAALSHLAHLIRRDSRPETPGHNPAGGFMVLALLALLLFQGLTGLFANDGLFVEGPLAALAGPELSDRLSIAHGISFQLIMLAVAAHILAVVFYAAVAKDNLVRPMMTGWKRVPIAVEAPGLAPGWKAAAALAAIAAAGAAAIGTLG